MKVRIQRAFRKSFAVLSAAALLSVFLCAKPARAAEATPSSLGFCVTLKIPVKLEADQPRNQKIAGTYCQPRHWQSGQHQLDILGPGAFYNSNYWNWPQNPSLYSYVNKTLAAGRATFAYDRLGSGQSSHPLSTEVTMPREAYILHQIVQLFRLGGYGFKQVNSVNHSYSSGIAMRESSLYQDIDRLVLTGYLHAPRNPVVAGASYAANQDPKFAGQNLDDGYLTTKPGMRSIFYAPTDDPSVIVYDDAHKDLASFTGYLGFLSDRAAAPPNNLGDNIKVPILLVDGQLDQTSCFDPSQLDCSSEAAVTANEASYYAGAKSFAVRTIPNTGHDVALSPTANKSFNIINTWLRTH